MYKDMMDTIGFVSGYDPELGAAMQRELGRQQANIELMPAKTLFPLPLWLPWAAC